MRNGPMQKSLTTEFLFEAVHYLAGIDPDLERIYKKYGPPPLWQRENGFATLLSIIIEQQVSLASAKATIRRLKERLPYITPQNFLQLDENDLQAIGFSRQKIRYGRSLAESVLNGQPDFEALTRMDDQQVSKTLTALKGIGPWSAHIFMMEALLRPDIWPADDLALVKAVQKVKGLREKPDLRDMHRIAEPWRPWRAVAARMLWWAYIEGNENVVPF